jgi:IclR family transcriptional regulator, acetate operon repressor
VAGNGSEPRRSVVSKVVAILRSFGSGGVLTVTEIAQVSDLPLSTAHRLVHELAAWGILHRGDDARYRVAPLSHTCDCGERPWGLRAVAAPVVEDLSAVTGSDVRLGVLDGHRVRYAEKAHGRQPFSAFSDAATLPAHATAMGKVLLAFSPAGTVDDVIQHGLSSYTSATVANARWLRRTVKITRLRGMAIVRGELLPDHSAVAVPVFGKAGAVLAAMEIRLRDVAAELPCVLPALTVAARALSRELGHDVPTAETARHPAPEEHARAVMWSVIRTTHPLASRVDRRPNERP